MPHIMKDGTAYAAGLDATQFAKIGTDPLDTEAQDLSGAVNEIKQSLSQLHARAYTVTKIEGALTSTETTFNNIQVGGEYRKFSDYDYLLFLLKYSNSDIRDTVLIPTVYWASGSQIVRQVLHGIGGATAANYNVSGFASKYNNDTSIKANTSGSNAFTFLEIIGLKVQAN